MYSEVQQRLASLANASDASLMSGRRVGLEKESLRVTENGSISQADHPAELGSALGHPSITTDFSEALLEMVTPPLGSAVEALDYITGIHQFILPRLPEGEHLWNTSMPCILRGAESIRIADFGQSHTGRMKRAYRRGLGARYGRRMQAIAGIHFNFSMPEAVWAHWADLHQRTDLAGQSLISTGYFHMMQNLLRIGWVVPYLFGASPAICQSFLAPGSETDLDTFNETTRFAPHGTSLRMGNIGYRYREDEPIDLSVRHCDLNSYIEDVIGHVTHVHPPYETLGIRNSDGTYQQLNACRLQIENEFYSTVRPKQIARAGEMPILALKNRGVRYLELRSVDLNIFEPAGLKLEQIAFLEMLMMFAWLDNGGPLDSDRLKAVTRNVKTVAHRGREPGLLLEGPDGEISLQRWGEGIIEAIAPIAQWLDAGSDDDLYTRSLKTQRDKFVDASLTPSAQVLAAVFESGSFFDFAQETSEAQHEALLGMPVNKELQNQLQEQVVQSISAREALEAGSAGNFDDFLADYFSQLGGEAAAIASAATLVDVSG